MKITQLILVTGAALLLAGCASDRGGTSDQYQYTTGYGEGSAPEPSDSPTMHPGMNPRDIRDPNALTRPEPPSMNTPTSPPNAPPRLRQGETP